MRNADMPAMPIPDDAESGGSLPLIAIDKTGANGLTKREHFAAMAMQGMLANQGLVDVFGGQKVIAKDAVKTADALLAELDKEPQP